MPENISANRACRLFRFLQIFVILLPILWAQTAGASGFGVFTQGASGLGQANAVVAHPTGPSSLYFNPALLNDVPGRQIEFGTTAILSKRSVQLADSGQTESANDLWNFPANLYYTHQASEKLTAGVGITFPFGLSNKWDKDYEGRYLGTYAEMFSMNINPAVSFRVTDRLSLAIGYDLLYLDTEMQAMINQTVVGGMLPPILGGPLAESLADVRQTFTGDGWGHGFNLGALYKLTERISLGAAYRSQIDIDIDAGNVKYSNVDPRLELLFPEGHGSSEIRLPAQFVAGIATRVTDQLIIEVGCRWEDWASSDQLKVDLQYPFLGQASQIIPRDWRSTWAWNLGGQYRLSDSLAINAGYLYAKNPVPDATLEPVIPDSDAHLFTIGADLDLGQWTVSGAFGYEYHEERDKQNDLGDPLGSLVAGFPVNTADGEYDTDIYLFGISVGYKF
ncbi:MAG: outer membrane protein transport protein [Desulfuromonadales bacterium]|nr:outer membrane protein transport protein [Desulfuromonadales bacterium]